MLLRGELVVGDVWVRGGKVIDPMKLFFRERRLPDRVLDCSGLLVAPGFIDLQVNGQNEEGGSCRVLCECVDVHTAVNG